jgi:hypothetical protein
MSTLSNITRSYNENITGYNNNIRSIISLLNLIASNLESEVESNEFNISPRMYSRANISTRTEPIFSFPNTNRFRNRNNNTRRFANPAQSPRLRLARELLYDGGDILQIETINDLMDRFQVQMQPVTVSPSLNQIQTATRSYNYSSQEIRANPDEVCPITLEQFEEGDEVCVIIYCNHLFKKEALYRWFNSNVRCPVCRYDVREYIEPEEDISGNNISSVLNENIINNTVDAIGGALRTAMNEFNGGTANIMSLELPIPITRTNSGTLSQFFRDISNNIN